MPTFMDVPPIVDARELLDGTPVEGCFYSTS